MRARLYDQFLSVCVYVDMEVGHQDPLLDEEGFIPYFLSFYFGLMFYILEFPLFRQNIFERGTFVRVYLRAWTFECVCMRVCTLEGVCEC